MEFMDEKFPKYWKNYVYQSLFAALSVFFITLVLNFEHAVVIASIGSTAFIVFSMPNNISAQPKRIIGGHVFGFFIGSCFAVFPWIDILLFGALWYALSVGLTLFVMVITDTEHPPAAGTALGMTIVGYSNEAGVAIITSVILLALIHYFAKPFIKDLV
ncbi:MAG: HPP family protein [Candidatus Marinimicrobia bacterium]|nr:HPP family protein [Candidatus Neomarinimicrobiota bacterium]